MSYPNQLYKVQALGNDFLIFLDVENAYDVRPSEVRSLCHRRFGIGADGVIRLGTQTGKDGVLRLFMDYANADGSLAQMCGNGVRASALFAKTVNAFTFSSNAVMELATRSGIKRVICTKDSAFSAEFAVEMGEWAVDETDNFSVSVSNMFSSQNDEKDDKNEGKLSGRFVDMGNEHIVCILNKGANLSIAQSLKTINLKQSPNIFSVSPTASALRVKEGGANVEFAEVEWKPGAINGNITMRVHERGVGETYSCGTGMCATAILATLMSDEAGEGISSWQIEVPGGKARVDVASNNVVLTGPAQIVGTVQVQKGIDMAMLHVNEELMSGSSSLDSLEEMKSESNG